MSEKDANPKEILQSLCSGTLEGIGPVVAKIFAMYKGLYPSGTTLQKDKAMYAIIKNASNGKKPELIDLNTRVKRTVHLSKQLGSRRRLA